MKVATIELLRERIVEIKASPITTAIAAAPVIEANLRRNARTKRGNVPSFGRMGDVPIAVKVNGPSIVVSGPDWVLKKAQQLGQVDEWVETVKNAASIEMRKGAK